MRRIVLVRMMVSLLGMTESVAKSFSTRKCNELGIIKDDDGFVDLDDAKKVFENYKDSKSSKYAEAAAKALKDWDKVTPEKFQDTVQLKQKDDAFVAAKVLGQLLVWCQENDYPEIVEQAEVIKNALMEAKWADEEKAGLKKAKPKAPAKK